MDEGRRAPRGPNVAAGPLKAAMPLRNTRSISSKEPKPSRTTHAREREICDVVVMGGWVWCVWV
jgi:hypothetical protein